MRKASTVTLLALATMLAACSDSSVAPQRTAADVPNVQGGGATAALTGWDTLRFSFVIDPSRDITYSLGAGNGITFPAGSLCDPTKSTYGDGEWDKPCTVATAPVTISVKAWLDAQYNPRLDFSPDVRFVPTSNPTGWVVLSFTDYWAAYNPFSAILYCRTPQSGCIDEALKDPTLVTIKDPVTGKLTRRVKHFSGYNVAAGFASSGPTMSSSYNMFGTTNTRTPSKQSVQPVLRKHQLPDHPTKSADIGPEGGELRLPQAGLTLIVPPGAVSSTTHFSVTSVGGKFVAYNFEPHGTHFNTPLVLKQQLKDTDHEDNPSVVGAYFASESQLNEWRNTALVDELLTATVENGVVSIPIWHFSGYMLASGRGGWGR